MSSQLEFIMQLYMMNMLQQQQRQQQQQQQQQQNQLQPQQSQQQQLTTIACEQQEPLSTTEQLLSKVKDAGDGNENGSEREAATLSPRTRMPAHNPLPNTVNRSSSCSSSCSSGSGSGSVSARGLDRSSINRCNSSGDGVLAGMEEEGDETDPCNGREGQDGNDGVGISTPTPLSLPPSLTTGQSPEMAFPAILFAGGQLTPLTQFLLMQQNLRKQQEQLATLNSLLLTPNTSNTLNNSLNSLNSNSDLLGGSDGYLNTSSTIPMNSSSFLDTSGSMGNLLTPFLAANYSLGNPLNMGGGDGVGGVGHFTNNSNFLTNASLLLPQSTITPNSSLSTNNSGNGVGPCTNPLIQSGSALNPYQSFESVQNLMMTSIPPPFVDGSHNSLNSKSTVTVSTPIANVLSSSNQEMMSEMIAEESSGGQEAHLSTAMMLNFLGKESLTKTLNSQHQLESFGDVCTQKGNVLEDSKNDTGEQIDCQSSNIETKDNVRSSLFDGIREQHLLPVVDGNVQQSSLSSDKNNEEGTRIKVGAKNEEESSQLDSLSLQSFPTPSKTSLFGLDAAFRQVQTLPEDNTSGGHQMTTPLPLSKADGLLTPPSSGHLSSSTGTMGGGGGGGGGGYNTNNNTNTNYYPTMSTTMGGLSVSGLTVGMDSFLNEENLRHLRKFSSYLECENDLCRQESLREHFHCYEEPCQGKILSKKDDIIRHLKWHKKRKESLLLGFARFSSSDDCEPEYGGGCAYNWKQTHYHCVYEECSKVYVSTSDVQMHANFHRKNSEIVQEGFRRFRAHENCRIEECPFFGKRISHYHCCREGCNHTFKNKADMDKHKTYHLKDFQLTQDGFKKILKTEPCPFDDCKYSGLSNHIHCVREQCNFILHSSSQMISHKRKHDRQEGEQGQSTIQLQPVTNAPLKTPKDSSEDDSPTSNIGVGGPSLLTPSGPGLTIGQVLNPSNTSTPLSSLSAEHFLARKRGRPPKKIQLPSARGESKDTCKRFKLSKDNGDNHLSQGPSKATATITSGGEGRIGSAATTTAAALPSLSCSSWTNPPANPLSASLNETNLPNFQLTHLMALFQLQNPLLYQNLYSSTATATSTSGIASSLPNVADLLQQHLPQSTSTSTSSNPSKVSDYLLNDRSNDFKE